MERGGASSCGGVRVPIWKQFLVLVLLGIVGAGGYEAYRTHLASETAASTSAGNREVPVEVALVERRRLSRTVEAVGSTRARQSIEIVPLASGRVEEIAFTPGQKVAAGQVLVRLDSDIERANLAEAEALLVEKDQAIERTRRLQRTNAVALAALEQVTAERAAAEAAVERTRRRLSDRVIRAPFSGVVGLTDVDLGARVDDETVLTTLDDLSEVEVEFSLPETLFSEIAAAQLVSARSAAFPRRIFHGRVAAIGSRIDAVSRSFRVRAIIPNPEGVLPSGMFMSLTLTLAEAEALVVPEEAVLVQAADTFVFVVEDGRAVRRKIVSGQRQDGLIAVTDGLTGEEAVVTRGLQRIRDGAQVRVLGDPLDTAQHDPAGSG
ncbi:efflux RND transporter periplasmic adaptor subunit [Limibaculum sp. M0105]|uniref:Efflux RND transporter periplasmic adaptor subunit n=1 Tax=Thermohalobaculum xanthum TaxID=2753746 RepID=A0A8J7M815_9RHOB|nr:efflux RND transporter periplasmic adaptor subunit [Thermohalobaculum xanthum]